MSFREFGRSVSNAVLDRVGRGVSRVQERRPLPVDLLESDDAYLAVFDAPGATSSDVQVRYVDGAVLVRIDRFRDFFQDYEMRFPGRGLALDGRVDLPEGHAVDSEAAEATLTKRGTLEVLLPKADDESTTESVDVAEETDAGDDAAPEA